MKNSIFPKLSNTTLPYMGTIHKSRSTFPGTLTVHSPPLHCVAHSIRRLRRFERFNKAVSHQSPYTI